ncbi:Hypothetical predicted protein [Lecanosticta acicola]|uniref:Uncharacterized protein n=1 Tax=Lecanosticta acicola TaxID=111012 RepID=A0AAI8YYV5_9PEZI|nr:Hypothetical predicted protein [Lecanosticta acicola]
MAVPLEALITNDPNASAVFTANDHTSNETIGLYLFTHHALQVICDDTDMDKPDEQIRGMATAIWTGLMPRKKLFWEHRAATARLLGCDAERFLLADGSTRLSKDNREKAMEAFAGYRRRAMGEFLDGAEISQTEDSETEALAADQEQLPATAVPSSPSTSVTNAGAETGSSLAKRLMTAQQAVGSGRGESPEPTPEAYRGHKSLASQIDTSGDFKVPDAAELSAPKAAASPKSTNMEATAATFVPLKEVPQGTGDDKTPETCSTMLAARTAAEMQSIASNFLPQSSATCATSANLLHPSAVDFTLQPAESIATAAIADELFDDGSDDDVSEYNGSTSASGTEKADMESSMSSLPQSATASTPSTPRCSKLDWAEESQKYWDTELQKNHRDLNSSKQSDKASLPTTAPRWKPKQLEGAEARQSGSRKPSPSGSSSAGKNKAIPSVKHEASGHDRNNNPSAANLKKGWQGFGDLNAAKQFSAQVTKNKSHTTHNPMPQVKPNPWSKPSKDLELAKKPAKNAWANPLTRSGPARAQAETSIETETKPLETSVVQMAAEDGQRFFIYQALPIICEDLDYHKADQYVEDVALATWNDLPRPAKKIWAEDAKLLRGGSALGASQLFSTERFAESRFTNDYRTQIIKALAERNDGELKYLQPEYDKLISQERKQAFREAKRNARMQKVYEEARSRPGSSLSKTASRNHSVSASVSSIPAMAETDAPLEQEEEPSLQQSESQAEVESTCTVDAGAQWNEPEEHAVADLGGWDTKRKIPGAKKKKTKEPSSAEGKPAPKNTTSTQIERPTADSPWKAGRIASKPKKKLLRLSETDPISADTPPTPVDDDSSSLPVSRHNTTGGWDEKRYVPGMKKKKAGKGKSEADSFFDSIEHTIPAAQVTHVQEDEGWTAVPRGGKKSKGG